MAIDSVASYSLLGRSGLRVSPLCLGTMTFGTEWGWGVPRETAYHLLDRYLEAGGNFIDTADLYTNGTSESFVGDYFAERKNRDRVVIATKFTFNAHPGDANAGGNGRKNIYRAIEGSLRRLKTDYLDLYWLHAWDLLTPIEEVMSTLTDLVRAGKVRYLGLSDVPAWYLARAQTMAELKGFERLAAMQLEYSLVERNIEREHLPAARVLGVGLTPWSPLGGGLLTGKFRREGGTAHGEGRLTKITSGNTPIARKLLSDRSWRIVETLTSVANELNRPASQVALNWVTKRRGVTSTIIGATRGDQIDSNLHSLEFDLPTALAQRLDEVSEPELVHPSEVFTASAQRGITGGTTVSESPPWSRG